MPIHEYVGNLHIHTPYSDGEGSHLDIAHAALAAGLDFVVVTDHNVWVSGVEGYYRGGPRRSLLVLVGEEVHDMRRDPQTNHMLVYGMEREVAPLASNPQALINAINEAGGLSFLAHPMEKAAPLFHEPAISWVDWSVSDYTGIELWNYMSEFKNYLTSRRAALQAALNPDQYISGPPPETIALWDRLLAEGKRVRIVGSADAHATRYSMGPISRVVFPYEYLFRCVNTHLVTPHAFTGDVDHDKQVVYNALRLGHAYIGYDLPASTRGFRFTAQGLNASAIMGDRIRLGDGVTLQIVSPLVADVRLLKDGVRVHQELEGTHTTYIARDPGVYRVEVYLSYKGKLRGWIFSNPIYIYK